MNTQQRHTIDLLRQRHYPVRVVSRTRSGALRCRVQRRMRSGYMNLLVYPTGAYITQQYFRAMRRYKGDISWLS